VAEDTRLRRRRFAKALAGSLLIYLVPLVGPHTCWLLIEVLIADVTRASGHKPLGWIALDFAAALVAQAALALLLAWPLAPRNAARVLVIVASAPVFFVAFEWTYLWLLPSYSSSTPTSHARSPTGPPSASLRTSRSQRFAPCPIFPSSASRVLE
jgi:hypothetical protein